MAEVWDVGRFRLCRGTSFGKEEDFLVFAFFLLL